MALRKHGLPGFTFLIAISMLAVSRPLPAQVAGGTSGTGGTSGSSGTSGTSGSSGQSGNNVGGIRIDAQGVVQPVFAREATGRLAKKRQREAAPKDLPADLNRFSKLRKVSLVRLEALCEEYAKKKQNVPEEMQFLAGLQRIDYVFIYPETKDLVIAGPAEGFAPDGVGRRCGLTTGRPPLRLDDLLVAFRAVEHGGSIGCSIDPNEQNLSQLKQYVARNSNTTTPEVAKSRYEQMARILGLQDVRVQGVAAETHLAAVLVEADYRMKRLTLGLETAPVRGLRSHLSMIGPGSNTVQRWWFAPLYDQFTRSEDRLAFQFGGQRVQLLAQEELVSDAGRRSSAPFTRVSTNNYAKMFTDKYPELAEASPVFAELQSAFDLAVLAALIQKEHLDEEIGWSLSLFLDPERAPVATYPVPRQVPTLVNIKRANRGTFIGLLGGGVTIDPMRTVSRLEFQRDGDNVLKSQRQESKSEAPPEKQVWWWD